MREQIIYEGPDSVAAIVMETITGSNGVIIPPKGYLPGVRRICDEFGILMICDEVMAGWCRTGKMFAFQNFDVVPDIVSLQRALPAAMFRSAALRYRRKSQITLTIIFFPAALHTAVIRLLVRQVLPV